MSNIRVELELDDGSFTSRMLHAGETVAQFNRNVGQGYSAVTKINEASQGFLSTLRDVTVILGVAHEAIDNVSRALGGWATDIVKINAEFERLTTLLKGMSRAADPLKEATNQIKFLRDYATQAPFSLKAITDTFVKMKSTGIDPMAGGLKAMVDGVAAMGGNDEILKRATIAITQMAGKGVIQMEELRQQLGEAMPRATELMARSMGLSMGELIKKISSGTVEAKSGLAQLFGELERTFGGAAAAQMNTFNGLMSQTHTILQNLALTAGETGFFDNVKRQLKDFNNLLSSNVADVLAKDFGRALDSVVTWLRVGLDAIVKFRNEIMIAGQYLAVAFGTKLAIGALTSMASMVAGVATEVRLLTVAWQAMQASIAFNNLNAATAPAAQAVSNLRLGLQNVAAILPMIGVGLGFISSTVLPLTAIVVGLALAFGFLTDKNKDAYDAMVKYGAQSEEQLALARKHVQALAAEYQTLKEQKEQVSRVGLSGEDQAFAGMAAPSEADLERYRVSHENAAKELATGEAQRKKKLVADAVRDRMEGLDAELIAVVNGFDKERNERAKKYADEIKDATNNHRDTQKLQQEYQNTGRELEIKWYDDRIGILQKYLTQAELLKESANEREQTVGAQMAANIIKQQNDIFAAREIARSQNLGVKTVDKEVDIDKLVAKGTQKLMEMKAEIAGNRAELAGASNEAAKLAYELENAAKYGPVDNVKVKQLIEDLKTTQAEAEKVQRILDGQNKFDQSITSAYSKAQNDFIEASTRGLSAIDKIAVQKQLGFFEGLKPQAQIARMFDGIKTSAESAGAAMNQTFGNDLQTNTESFYQKLVKIYGVFTGIKGTGSSPAPAAPSSGSYPTAVTGDYVSNIVRRESSGDPTAAAKGSTAVGLGQFIESTWMEFLGQVRPDIAASGKQAALDARKDPILMQQAIAWYASQNAQKFDKAGVDVNDANLSLAHFLGPGGAIAALTKSSDTLLTTIPQLNAARAANPDVFRDKLTVGDLKSWAQAGFGTGMTAPITKNSSFMLGSALQGATPEQSAALQATNQLIQATDKLNEKNALSDYFKQVVLDTKKADEDMGGLNKKVDILKEKIRGGEFGPDVDVNSSKYEAIIAAVDKLDKAEQMAADRKKLRNKLDAFEQSKPADMAALEERRAELDRRMQDESKFKFSNNYYTEFKKIQQAKMDQDKGLELGLIGQDRHDDATAFLEAKQKELRDLEIGAVIQTEQLKNQEIEKSLLTQDQARERTYQLEVKRLENILALSDANGEQRAKLEEITQNRMRLARIQTDMANPITKQMKDWTDLGASIDRSFTSWTSSATDKLADFVVTGKADFASLRDSILKDIAKMAIQGTVGSIFGGAKGKVGSSGFGFFNAAKKHEGGFAGEGVTSRYSAALFANAPRFHGGGFPGLDPSEVPIIAKKGEVVGWPEQMAQAFGGSGGGVSQANHFEVNIQGSSGTHEQNTDLAQKVSQELMKAAEQAGRAAASKEMMNQLRPGGLLRGR